jgi:hypothetical protein
MCARGTQPFLFSGPRLAPRRAFLQAKAAARCPPTLGTQTCEEEDTCMSYEEEDTCMSYAEEDTCMSYEEEDTCMSYADTLGTQTVPVPRIAGRG